MENDVPQLVQEAVQKSHEQLMARLDAPSYILHASMFR